MGKRIPGGTGERAGLIPSPGGSVVLISKEKTILFANREAVDLFGIENDLFSSDTNCCDVLKLDICKDSCPADRAIEIDRPVHDYFVNREGDSRSYWVTTTNLKGVEGDSVGIIHSVRDFSSVRHLIDEEMRIDSGILTLGKMKEILDCVEEGIMSVDDNEKIDFFNRAMERLTGYHAEEMVGQPLTAILRLSSSSSFSFHDHIEPEGRERKIQGIIITAAGVTLNVEMKSYPVTGRVKGGGFIISLKERHGGGDLHSIEKERIYKALIENNWKVAKAASTLGYSRVTLWRRMKDFGIFLPNRNKNHKL